MATAGRPAGLGGRDGGLLPALAPYRLPAFQGVAKPQLCWVSHCGWQSFLVAVGQP